MRYSGLILQFVAVLTITLGALAGIAHLASDPDATAGGIILVSSVVGGVLLFGRGGAFRTLTYHIRHQALPHAPVPLC